LVGIYLLKTTFLNIFSSGKDIILAELKKNFLKGRPVSLITKPGCNCRTTAKEAFPVPKY